MQKTKFTELFDIPLPIIQAPMAGATTPELIAAVSNAGGLGSLGAGYMSPTEIKQTIKEIRELTNKPFVVNLFIPEEYHVNSDQIKNACVAVSQCSMDLNIQIDTITEPYSQSFAEQVSVLIEEKIPVFSFTFGILSPELIVRFKKNNTLLIGTATTLAEAQLLEKNGIDAIAVQGSEAGGHRGSFLNNAEHSLIGLFVLLPSLVKHINIPIIASGGIMNGKGIVAAIAAGASAVQMGTAFLSCQESGIPAAYKQTLLTQQQDNTVLTRAFSGKLARGIENKFIRCMNQKKQTILDYPIQNALTTVVRKKARENNNADFMSLWAGQSAMLCRNMAASELMSTLVLEAEAIARNNN